MQKTYNFKTTIKCGGCIATVTPFLNGINTITHWEVDTDVADKILKVDSNDLNPQTVIDTLATAGYSAELID